MHGIQEYKEEGEAYTSALVSSRFSLEFFLNEIACILSITQLRIYVNLIILIMCVPIA